MKAVQYFSTRVWRSLFTWGVFMAISLGAVGAMGQGAIINFNSASYFSGTSYEEAGLLFGVVIPTGSIHDDLGVYPPIYQGAPQNSTPFMVFFRQYNPSDYVSLSLTSGFIFGLTSVQLADPTSPSSTMLPITFLGYKLDGSTVSDTFTTPGNGATTFQNYTFNSAFASGLTSVEIHANRWAMDNLVFAVPEPGTVSIGLVGLVSLALLGMKRRTLV